jgi:hypothetical protein
VNDFLPYAVDKLVSEIPYAFQERRTMLKGQLDRRFEQHPSNRVEVVRNYVGTKPGRFKRNASATGCGVEYRAGATQRLR